MCAGVLMFGASSIPVRVMATDAVAQAQTAVQVKGVVLDSNGEPIMGAAVIEVVGLAQRNHKRQHISIQ